MFLQRRFSLSLCAGLLLAGAYAQAATESVELKSVELKTKDLTPYAYVGQELIAARGGVEQVTQPEDENKPNLTIIALTEQQKLSMAFELLAKKEQGQAPISENARILINDQELYSQVFPCIDNTQTVCGKAVLACELIKPSYEKARVHQELVRTLVSDQTLYKKVGDLLGKARDAETALFSFQIDETPVTRTVIDQLYFGKLLSGGNKSVLALEAGTRLDNVLSLLKAGALPLSLVVEPFVGTYVVQRFFVHSKTPAKDAWNTTKSFLDRAINPFASKRELAGFSTPEGVAKANIEYTDKIADSAKFKMIFPTVESYIAGRKMIIPFEIGVKMGALGYLVFMQSLLIKDIAKHVCQVRDTANYLQARLIGVATFVDSLKKIKALSKNNPVLAQGLTKLDAIAMLLSRAESTSKELQTLLNLLKTNTFKGQASYFSLTGRILAAYKLMQELKDAFVPAMEALGELDACYSMATLYKKFEGQRVGYSFVEFQESATPYLKLEEFWNPVVDPQIVVANSIELGGSNGARSVILTGSNTGGKSTILKAMLLNVTLAHAFGIAPAKSAIMTPWAYIGSSLHILDNTAEGISLFKAEVLRAQALLKSFEALLPYQFGFVVIDELFTGTSAEVGQEQAFAFAKHLTGFSNTIFILATHFKNLTELEEATGGVCKNYKVDVSVAADGSIIRPFKLEEGICTTNIAQNILHEAMGNVSFKDQVCEA